MAVVSACGLQSPWRLTDVTRSSVEARGWEIKAAVTGLSLVVSSLN